MECEAKRSRPVEDLSDDQNREVLSGATGESRAVRRRALREAMAYPSVVSTVPIV